MSSDTVIRMEGLGKQFRLGQSSPYLTITESLAGLPGRLMDMTRGVIAKRSVSENAKFMWALRDFTLNVKKGDVLGIIGRNGAGKSTLLKVLSQITEPTCGRADIYGRLNCLLEVGTGFHSELTGRENIFLNGAILGMSRREILWKFDDIVDFSGVSKFIDTPVKRYSSGMTVRLAFAVAAHLEPEVLVIDEVLAVGDAEFQKRCIGKMESVAREGRTILFVSHNMAAVQNLCTRAVLLESGKMTMEGSVSDVVDRYLEGNADSESAYDIDLTSHPGRTSTGKPLIKRLRIAGQDGNVATTLVMGADATFHLTIETPDTIEVAALVLVVYGARGEKLTKFHSRHQKAIPVNLSGRSTMSCTMKNCRLVPGRYYLSIYLKSRSKMLDRIESGLSFDVAATDIYGTGIVPEGYGFFASEASWEFPSN